MANQEESRDGVTPKDGDWPSPDVERGADGPRSGASQGAGLSGRNGPSDPDSRKQ
ncbi:MAG: hypothetical protein ABI409_09110 [Ramlibacter sp.]